MTLEESKTLKEGQEIYYLGSEYLPEKVTIEKIIYDGYGKIEIHLVDNCYIPERDLKYVFVTFDECANSCKKLFEEKLEKLRLMISLNNK